MNERGTGSAQYHPRMMLALLVYCYANGIFGSRRIERATYRDTWRRTVIRTTTRSARSGAFEAVAGRYLLAKELKLLRVGTVSVARDLDANANKRNSIRYDRAVARAVARRDRGVVGSGGARRHGHPQGLPEELSRRDKLRAKLDRACAEGTACAGACGLGAGGVRAQGGGAGAAYGIAQGSAIKRRKRRTKAQINLTDADSARCAGAGTMSTVRRTTRRRQWMPTAVSWCWGRG